MFDLLLTSPFSKAGRAAALLAAAIGCSTTSKPCTPESQGHHYRATVIGRVTQLDGNCPDNFDLAEGNFLEFSVTTFVDGSSCQCGQGPIVTAPVGWTWSPFSPSPARDCQGNFYWANFQAQNGTCAGTTTIYITAQKIPTGPVAQVTNPPLADLTRLFTESSDASSCLPLAKKECGDDFSVQIDEL
jgi:hypothetical protein